MWTVGLMAVLTMGLVGGSVVVSVMCSCVRMCKEENRGVDMKRRPEVDTPEENRKVLAPEAEIEDYVLLAADAQITSGTGREAPR